MIIAVWKRYVDGSRWWLLLLLGVLIADALIGGWLITQEIRLMKEWMQ